MSKEKFNKIRIIICMAYAIVMIITFLLVVGFRIYALINSLENLKEISLDLIYVWEIVLLITGPFYIFFFLHNFKKYGKIKFNPEYTKPTVLHFKEDVSKKIKKDLILKEYRTNNVNIQKRRVNYYIKKSVETDVHLFIFMNLEYLTQSIYEEYKNNYLKNFLDSIADQEKSIIEDYRYFYVYFIINIKNENSYSKKIITYNLPTHPFVIFMPIIINETKKTISIANYSDGKGQILFKKQKKKIINYVENKIKNIS